MSICNGHLLPWQDKKGYVQCFIEVVERTGSSEGYTLLGDAYMTVHMPDKAITTYETALKRNPKDSLVKWRHCLTSLLLPSTISDNLLLSFLLFLLIFSLYNIGFTVLIHPQCLGIQDWAMLGSHAWLHQGHCILRSSAQGNDSATTHASCRSRRALCQAQAIRQSRKGMLGIVWYWILCAIWHWYDV